MTDADGTILHVEDVVAGYVPEVDILRGVHLAVRKGEIVSVVGPNGAGKSTLIKTVCGLVRPRRGHIKLRGEEITKVKPHRIARRGMGYVPQLDNVFANMTVEENLELGAIGRPGVEADARIASLYELFPRLGERRRQPAGTLSGGERQMVAIARALVPEPALLLLDEPSAGLAPAFVDAIFDKVAEINAAGVTILMVEQNARRALTMSHRGYVLDVGTNRFEGPGRELIQDPKVAELYLGGASRSGARGAAGAPATRETP